MDPKDVISFFDRCAESWDAELIRNENAIERILDNAQIKENTRVLDVACGTGVLFPDYIKRGAVVTGVDISPEMVKIAKNKFPEMQVICADVEALDLEEKFDVVMVYNAFPHFPYPERLIEKLSTFLHKGGRLSVAHGMSREDLHKLHGEKAKAVSRELPCETELAKLLEPLFYVDIIISDNQMYQVSGIKKM